MKKTMSVLWLIEKVNHMNRQSTCVAAVRQGWNALLEDALHESGMYSGFGYLHCNEVPPGEKPGCIRADDGMKFPDETRRFYYVHQKLREVRR